MRATVPSVTLRIAADLCGPISVGTVAVIKLLAEHLELQLDVAAAYVDRCVFGAEEVNIPAPTAAAAARFVTLALQLPAVPQVLASAHSA